MLRGSILITTFNRSELLYYGLSSYLNKIDKDIEIIILNDGNEEIETLKVVDYFKDRLNIKYVYTGSVEKRWRIPGFAFNIGFKMASSRYVILTCAEMYNINVDIYKMISILENDSTSIVISDGIDDNGTTLESLKQNQFQIGGSNLNTMLPFYMGLDLTIIKEIGGYDEEFVGIAFDDDDFVGRLKLFGCNYKYVPGQVIHLYHERNIMENNEIFWQKWHYNKNLYESKKTLVKRNVDREWGIL